MGVWKLSAEAMRDRVHRQSVNRVEYIVVEIDGVERKVSADDIVEVRSKGRSRPRVSLGVVKPRRSERVRQSADGAVGAAKPVGRVRPSAISKKSFPLKGAAPRRPAFDQLREGEQALVLQAWEESAAARRASLNYVTEFERSGRQYSEADADGNVIVHQSHG